MVAVGLAVLAATPAAAEQAVPRPTQTVSASAADMFVISDRLAGQGRLAQAETILALLARDPHRDVRNEARFRQSLLLEKAGSTRAAAVLLRKILDEQPDAAGVRLKLASLMHALGDENAALRELRAVRSATLPPAMARFVDRVAASLQASKPFGVQVEVALAPDSNINRATRSDTLGTIFGDFNVDADSKRQSGVGAAVRFLAQRRLPLGPAVSLVAKAGSDLSLYREKDFNDISADVSIGPEFRRARTRLAADIGVGQRWYGMKSYQRQLRLSGNAARAIGSVAQGRFDASYRRIDNMVNDLQDGHGLTLGARYERALSPQMSIGAQVVTDRFRARDPAYSTRSWIAGLTAYRDAGRATIGITAEIGRLKADERLEILPHVRRDRLLRLTIGAVFRHLTVSGFAPMTRIVIERNRSTVELYDYRRTRTEFGISRAF